MSDQNAAELMSAECLCFRARRVSRALTRMYDEELRPLGILSTQLTLLNAVALGEEGGATMARLAEVLAMDPTTLSRNLRPLERMGLLRIERSAQDGRVRIAVLSEEGQRCVQAALPLWKRAHARIVEALGSGPARDLRDRFDRTVAATLAGPRPPLAGEGVPRG